jgi:hypothetical protein
MSSYGSGNRPGDEDAWRPPEDAGPGQQSQPEQPRPGKPQPGQQPQYGQPQPGQPQPGQQPEPGQQPQYGQPQYGQPQPGQPQYGQPQPGQPQYGEPQYGQPQYGQPQPGQPQYGQPQYGGQPGGPQYQDPSTPQYPSAPPYGSGYPGGGEPTATPELPTTVHWASIAIITRSLLSILATFITFARLDSIIDEAERRSNVTLDRAAIRASVVSATVISLILAVLFILLAIQVRRGKNWARIVAIVFAALGIIGGFLTLAQAGRYGAALNLLGVINLLLAIATVVLLALGPSNEFFRARSKKQW